MKNYIEQAVEFDACEELCKAYKNLPAIVDDDYPRMRHYYNVAVDKFVAAATANRGVK